MQFAKFVTQKHKEQNRKTFGGNIVPDVDLDTLLVNLENIMEEHDYQFIHKQLTAIQGTELKKK